MRADLSPVGLSHYRQWQRDLHQSGQLRLPRLHVRQGHPQQGIRGRPEMAEVLGAGVRVDGVPGGGGLGPLLAARLLPGQGRPPDLVPGPSP